MNRAQRKCFNRINSCRSIPTSLSQLMVKLITKVSIVSIHADQSRHRNGRDGEVFTEGFNRINSCRSIPTVFEALAGVETMPQFQSYQFMQINPDLLTIRILRLSYQRFNRINSCRSIPTWEKRRKLEERALGFNRINSCRSIPTGLGC